MKRILICLLALLLLTGCGTKMPEATTAPTEQTEPTTGLYEPESSMEQATGGAVRAYPLQSLYQDLEIMGSKLLLISDTELSVLMGEYCQIAATMIPQYNIYNVLADVSVTGFAYRDGDQIVLRNPQLQESQRIDLPAGLEGDPLVSLQRGEIFYVSGPELRALHMETGVSRLIKSQSCQSQTLIGLWFEGSVIGCRVVEESGKERTVYICADTGRTLSEDQTISSLQTWQDRYFLHHRDGQVEQLIFGTRKGEPQCFYPTETDCMPVPALSGVVSYTAAQEGLKFSFYDLTTGKRAARVQFPDVQSLVAVNSDGEYLWLLAATGENTQTLYRWDVKNALSNDSALYTGPLYTAENPDADGLAACRDTTQQMKDTYGVSVFLWQDAVDNAGEWEVTGEYQIPVIAPMLEQIRWALSQLPEEFLSITGDIRVSILRALPDGMPWTQIWQEGACCIYLTPQADTPAALLQGIGYGVDAYVLGNSRDYDDWNDLNPSDFTYTGTAQPDLPYLEGEDRHFVDSSSAAYPHTDRSSIFAQALLPENGATFEPMAMQAKLLRLCEAIREAYELEESPDTYSWEQYLQTSLADTQ